VAGKINECGEVFERDGWEVCTQILHLRVITISVREDFELCIRGNDGA
jgi:hypothetical protein